MKSFIETQRALLAEIQNGCKRNFILAKEKEETEQKMRQSASMAEIATEDGTGEEEEHPASEENKHTDRKEGEEGETTGSEEQTSNQSVDTAETNDPQMNLESDSDTEDEEEKEVVTKSSSTVSSSTDLNQPAPQIQTGVAQPLLSASHTPSSPSASPAGGPSVISGITVTESSVPPGTPPSPGRCISVSSPGRGHKIFMVTRVESPPEQQQLQLHMNTSAAPGQPKETSKRPADVSTPMTQQTQLPPTCQTQLGQEDMKESLLVSSTDCKLREQSPVAHVHAPPNTTQTQTLEQQSASQPVEDVTTSILDPEETVSSQQTPALPSDSPSVQLTEELTESTKSPQPEPTCLEGKKEGEDEESGTEDRGQVMSSDSTEEECKQLDKLSQTQTSVTAEETLQQPLMSVHEQLQKELASASEETLSLNQMEEEEEAQEDVPDNMPENENHSLTKAEGNQEEPCPQQQTEADKQGVQTVLSITNDPPAPFVMQVKAQESNPSTGEDSKSLEPASTMSVSLNENSAAEALEEEEEVVGSALPNGLKPEFSLHLLDTESPKPGSCVMEHGVSPSSP